MNSKADTAFELLLASIPWNKRHNLSDRMKDYIFNSIANNPNRLIRFMAELLSVSLSPTSAFNALLFDEVARSVPPQKRNTASLLGLFIRAQTSRLLLIGCGSYFDFHPTASLLPSHFFHGFSLPRISKFRTKPRKALSLCLIRKPEASEALSSALGSYDDDYVDERIIASIYGAAANS